LCLELIEQAEIAEAVVGKEAIKKHEASYRWNRPVVGFADREAVASATLLSVLMPEQKLMGQ
jgi:hypothetical protein